MGGGEPYGLEDEGKKAAVQVAARVVDVGLHRVPCLSRLPEFGVLGQTLLFLGGEGLCTAWRRRRRRRARRGEGKS